LNFLVEAEEELKFMVGREMVDLGWETFIPYQALVVDSSSACLPLSPTAFPSCFPPLNEQPQLSSCITSQLSKEFAHRKCLKNTESLLMLPESYRTMLCEGNPAKHPGNYEDSFPEGIPLALFRMFPPPSKSQASELTISSRKLHNNNRQGKETSAINEIKILATVEIKDSSGMFSMSFRMGELPLCCAR
jgi:hypothetical protein